MEHSWADLKKEREWYRNLDVNRRIKARRIELGLSQLKLGKMIGHTTNGHVSNVEKEKAYLSLEQIEKFSIALSTTADKLLGK